MNEKSDTKFDTKSDTKFDRTINPKSWNRSKTIIVVVVAVVLLLGAFGMMYLDKVTAPIVPSPFAGMPVTEMKGQFVDINEDGKLDFVVSAQVIINPGNVNFLQPTQSVK
jgi:hypothetical protein